MFCLSSSRNPIRAKNRLILIVFIIVLADYRVIALLSKISLCSLKTAVPSVLAPFRSNEVQCCNIFGRNQRLYSVTEDRKEKKFRKLVEYTQYSSRVATGNPVQDSSYCFAPSINQTTSRGFKDSIKEFLHQSFIPHGELSKDYFVYSSWRVAQRFVSACSNVFGTQALVLALGFKKKSIGLAAATTWVLKDALGKITRIFWATKYGRKFDCDAKKWRFRSSLIYATGNALEILTYIFPAYFLITAALANALKQMSMLTSSATRNTIYKSFSQQGDNIGDITAKGEAQTAIIDLLGMAMGIFISSLIGTERRKIGCVFLLLSTIDISFIFHEVRSVVFRNLNFERTGIVLHKLFPLLDGICLEDEDACINDNSPAIDVSRLQNITPDAVAQREKLLYPTRQGEKLIKTWSNLVLSMHSIHTLTPEMDTCELAATDSIAGALQSGEGSDSTPSTGQSYSSDENLKLLQVNSRVSNSSNSSDNENSDDRSDFMKYLACSGGSGNAVYAKTSAGSKEDIIEQSISMLDDDEKFVVVVNARLLKSSVEGLCIKSRLRPIDNLRLVQGFPVVLSPQILLHKSAAPIDIFRALMVVHRTVYQFCEMSESLQPMGIPGALRKVKQTMSCSARYNFPLSQVLFPPQRSRTKSAKLLDSLGLGPLHLLYWVQNAYKYEHQHRANIICLLESVGWNMQRFMYGTIKTRVEWDTDNE